MDAAFSCNFNKSYQILFQKPKTPYMVHCFIWILPLYMLKEIGDDKIWWEKFVKITNAYILHLK
jgi:hypothetical protein